MANEVTMDEMVVCFFIEQIVEDKSIVNCFFIFFIEFILQ